MSNWIRLQELWDDMRKEQIAKLRRGELLELYFNNWKEDDMGNRKRLKGNVRINVNATPFLEKARQIKSTLSGRYNAYVCDTCGKAYLTLDIDHGTTPAFGPCFATEGCNGRAHSMWYPSGDPPANMGEPIIHWVKPTAEEFTQLCKTNVRLAQQVNQGGLIRKATEATPTWVREML